MSTKDSKKKYKWNIDIDSIKCDCAKKVHTKFQAAKSYMKARTEHYDLYGLLAKNKSIHEGKKSGKYFSEGSTQYILRKVLAETIQRVPDGELITQYDKASREAILLEYIFNNKILTSEIEGKNMMANLTKAFKMSFIYAFAPVRIGFEKDFDDDIRVSFNLEQWSDIFVDPGCRDICAPEVVYFRQYMSKDELLNLLDDNDAIKDSTYSEDCVKYIIDHELYSPKNEDSKQLADKLKGVGSELGVELLTEYRKGSDEFITYVPAIDAIFRRVPNYDPRKEIPWTFLVLEPDADFPLGVSQVEFLLADQQFNDLFQTSAYKNLLLAMEPPIMVGGWETNPSSYKYEPRKIWNLGNNPNNVKVEPVKIENSILKGWTSTREAVAAAMVRNLNIADGTVAKDAGLTYSKTAPGVEMQDKEKTVNINQYQKRVEIFFQEWATKALRMYVNSMGGIHELTVDEETRRRLFDIGDTDIIVGNRIFVDFDELSVDTLSFSVRSGSLVQKKEDKELDNLTKMVQPFIQNLNGWSEDNRTMVENEIILPVMRRMVELANTDISNSLSESISMKIAKDLVSGVQQQVDNQQGQIMQMQDQIDQMAGQQLPESEQGNPALSNMPEGEMAETFAEPSSVNIPPVLPQEPESEESAGQQVNSYEDLLYV